MARKALIQNNLKREKLVKKYLKKRLDLKKDSQKFPRNSSTTRLKKRCFSTGNTRGVYKFFGLSRHKTRDYFNLGFLPGVTKSGW